MAKFDNAKVGDRVWYIIEGWGEVERVIKNIGIRVRFKVSETVEVSNVFTFEGKRYQLNDKYPMLFWNEIKLPTDEEDKRFDLVEYLKENLQPVEFNEDKFNYFLTYNVRSKELEFNASMICIDIHLTYFHLNSDELKNIEKVLNDNKVTIQQLKQAYKELGWL